MGLFTKKIGPVFLKTSNQAKEYVEKLKALQEKSDENLKDEIGKRIIRVRMAMILYSIVSVKRMVMPLCIRKMPVLKQKNKREMDILRGVYFLPSIYEYSVNGFRVHADSHLL